MYFSIYFNEMQNSLLISQPIVDLYCAELHPVRHVHRAPCCLLLLLCQALYAFGIPNNCHFHSQVKA